LPVICEDVGQPDAGPQGASLRDLSAIGAGLLLRRPAATRALFRLSIGGARDLLARAVHVTPQGRSWLVGCAFVRELDEAGLGRFGVPRVPAPPGDARRWERFACDVPATCSPPGAPPQAAVEARVLDAAAGGLRVALPCAFDPGDLVTLHLQGEGGPRELLWVVRAVRAAGGWQLGCEFADPLTDAELDDVGRQAVTG
jgi:hypothetical protein